MDFYNKQASVLQVNTGSLDDHLDVRLEYTGEFADHFHSKTAALKATNKF